MKKQNLELKKLPANAMYEECGIQVDFSSKIFADDIKIRYIHTSVMKHDEIYLEWLSY